MLDESGELVQDMGLLMRCNPDNSPVSRPGTAGRRLRGAEGRIYLAKDFTLTTGKLWSFRAFLTFSSSQAALSLRLKRTSCVLTFVSMLPCSTHGRVASALRTRSGQPDGQFMAGTSSTTSVCAVGVAGASGLLHPIVHIPNVRKARIERRSVRICGFLGGSSQH